MPLLFLANEGVHFIYLIIMWKKIMIEDVEAILAQLYVTILMIWKPVIKSIHSFKIHTLMFSIILYPVISTTSSYIYRKLKYIFIITSQNNSISNGKTNVRLNDAVWYSWDIFRDLMKHNSLIRYVCYEEEDTCTPYYYYMASLT